MAQARQLTLTDEQRQDLLDCRDHHPKADVREKAAAILKVAAGQAVRQVAAHGLLRSGQPKKVGQWIDRYLAEGRAGLLVRKGRGRKPAFSPSRPRRGQKRLARAALSEPALVWAERLALVARALTANGAVDAPSVLARHQPPAQTPGRQLPARTRAQHLARSALCAEDGSHCPGADALHVDAQALRLPL